jgi:hypothetical protein
LSEHSFAAVDLESLHHGMSQNAVYCGVQYYGLPLCRLLLLIESLIAISWKW